MSPAATMLLAGAVLAVTGCAGSESNGDDPAVPSGTLLVAGAASLTDALGLIAEAFEASEAGAGVEVETTLAGSSSLALSIEEGAPIDVFASANDEVMAQLVDAGAMEDGPTVFATNELVLAVPADRTGPDAPVSSIGDVAVGDLFVGACAPQVPCGAYTDELLALAGVEADFDTRDADVRAVVTKLVEGELDAGFVYRSDLVAFDEDLAEVTLPPELRIEARYPVGIVADAPNRAAALAFVDFLSGAEAAALLESAGFGTP